MGLSKSILCPKPSRALAMPEMCTDSAPTPLVRKLYSIFMNWSSVGFLLAVVEGV